jgi:D-lactate dehydrogenase (cytochrome)
LIRKTDPDAIRGYLGDASGMPGGSADAVLLPESADEAAAAIAEAGARGIPITISGGGTGLAGGRVPLGGWVLATDRLGGVRRVERTATGGLAICGPAATLADLDRAAAAAGLFLPPDPTETSAWVGGVLATNASGGRSFHYGPIRRFVRRLALVLPDGTRLDVPRGRYTADDGGMLTLPSADGERRVPAPRVALARSKSATGYAGGDGLDLVDLVVGSEGTLGLVTEAEIELLPRPEAVLAGIVFFPSEASCLAAVVDVRARSYQERGYAGPAPSRPDPERSPRGAASRRLLARALEFFGADALEFVRGGGTALPTQARAALQFEQEHEDGGEEAVAALWAEALEAHGALLDDSWIALGESERERIRAFRHALPVAVNEWLARHSRRKYGTDLSVPDDAFAEMFRTYRDDLGTSGLLSATWGHVGDNHLHLNLLPRDDAEEAAAKALFRRWVKQGAALGGAISAEHGIGKLKAALLAEAADPEALAAMRRTKAALDPAGILGRGSLFGEW